MRLVDSLPLRRAAFVAAGLVLVLVLGGAIQACRRPLTVATYNIRRFGVEPTDLRRLTAILDGVDADVIAVQEIQDRARFDELRGLLSRGKRRYAAVLSACGGRSEMLVGYLYDTRKVTLEGTREFAELDPAGEGRCHDGQRPGLVGVFKHARGRLHLLTIHLTAGGDADKAETRRLQWDRAFRITAALEAEGATAIAILGDTNSTGYLDNRHGERDFIRGRAKDKKLDIVTDPLACSEYFHPPEGGLQPSLLDHVVTTRSLARKRSARVHGYCVELACRPRPPGDDPPEFATVSDHCPVSFEL